MEIFLIFLVILLVFGAKRIPEIARGLGKGIREFKSATRDITSELTMEDQRIQKPQSPAQAPTPRSNTDRQASPTQAEQHSESTGTSPS